VIFPFFGAALSEPAAGRFGGTTFLLAGGAVGLAFAATCAAEGLVCRFECGGMKRARAAADVFPTSVVGEIE
jgi:hypothetical protein